LLCTRLDSQAGWTLQVLDFRRFGPFVALPWGIEPQFSP